MVGSARGCVCVHFAVQLPCGYAPLHLSARQCVCRCAYAYACFQVEVAGLLLHTLTRTPPKGIAGWRSLSVVCATKTVCVQIGIVHSFGTPHELLCFVSEGSFPFQLPELLP